MANPYIQNLITARQSENTSSVVAQNAAYTTIKPENPEGYIVKENVLQSAGSSVKSLAKTGVYFVNAANGKGTDYTVGRINDGARLLGSLGIAAALASTAKNPKAKMMEFIGFATWFASMSLWPKFLGTAIKATKGVDINQQYVDSYGRRKGFFEDAQYITWDLYKDKDLYKMGDKLGIPQNIENRKDAIKEKAKQIATQGNTLMMLTAGFATPIATALICNTLENPVSKLIEMRKLSGTIKPDLKAASEFTDVLKTGDKGSLTEFFANRYKNTVIGTAVEKEVKKLVKAPEFKETEVKRLFEVTEDFLGKKRILSDLKKISIGDIADSMNANNWGKETLKIVKAFGIPKEIQQQIADGKLSSADVIQRQLEEFAKPGNEEKLSRTVKEITPSIKKVTSNVAKEGGRLTEAWTKVGMGSKKLVEGFTHLGTAIERTVGLETANIENKITSTKASFYRPLLVLDGMINPEISANARQARLSGMAIGSFTEKYNKYGITETGFGKFIHEVFAPITRIMGGDTKFRAEINEFHKGIMKPLGQIAGGVKTGNGYYPFGGSNAINNDVGKWTTAVGKNFHEFVADACSTIHVKNSWLKKVLFVAVPVVAVSLLAISQFGKKNNYNSDVYIEKGSN